MNDKDKIIVKKSGMAIIEAVIDEIASKLPGIKLAWGLSKALFGSGMELRQKRVLEWVEMVRDNPTYFTEQILQDEKFQDGFVYSLERYLIERNQQKRQIFKNIFLGFTKAEDKEKFPLEKFTHTLSQLSELDITTLSDVDVEKAVGSNYQIYGGNFNRIENIFNLINEGILLDVTGSRLGHNPENSPFVKLSIFGKEFIKYVKEENGNEQ